MYSPSQQRAANGKFGSGGTAAQQNATTTSQLKAYQAAHGLPVTGQFDARTTASLRAVAAGKTGSAKKAGGKAKSGAAAARKTAAATKHAAVLKARAARAATAKMNAQHAATAAAFNSLSPIQKSGYYQHNQPPPGYEYKVSKSGTRMVKSASTTPVSAAARADVLKHIGSTT